MEKVLKRRILLHFVNGMSLQGVLMERAADGLILRASTLLSDDGAADTSLAGETFVPTAQILFAQLDD